MLDKLSTQKRLFIAIAISLLFFIAYDFLFLADQRKANEANKTELNSAPVATTPSNAPAQNSVAPVKAAPILASIEAEQFSAKIDHFGQIASFKLKESKYQNEDGSQIDLVDPSKSPMPLNTRFSDPALNHAASTTPYKIISGDGVLKAGDTLKIAQNLPDLTLTKTIVFKDNGAYELRVELSKPSDFFITPGHRPNIAADGYTVHGTLLRKSDDSLEIIEDGDSKGDEQFSGVDLLSNSDRYYTALFYDINRSLNVYIQNSAEQNTISFIRANSDKIELLGYIGPKDHATLNAINPALEASIEYGWFTFIARPMFLFLNWLHTYIGNWGWAIVALTIVIRIILFPLTFKGMVSMNKLKEIAPKMKELQAKYKGDPAKLNTHMMELYKKHGANPMGGCLPIIIQIPIFFAIYRVLLNAIELKGAAWMLWINDLAVLDPYFILPVLMGLTMFLQQKITPTNFTDPMQEKIMKFLPLIFTFFFATFPAGLTLYWFVNNVCSVAQQAVVNRIFARQKAVQLVEKKDEN